MDEGPAPQVLATALVGACCAALWPCWALNEADRFLPLDRMTYIQARCTLDGRCKVCAYLHTRRDATSHLRGCTDTRGSVHGRHLLQLARLLP